MITTGITEDNPNPYACLDVSGFFQACLDDWVKYGWLDIQSGHDYMPRYIQTEKTIAWKKQQDKLS